MVADVPSKKSISTYHSERDGVRLALGGEKDGSMVRASYIK